MAERRTRTQGHSLVRRTLGSEVVLEVALTIRLALMTAPGGAGPTPGQWTATAEPVPPRGPDRHAAFSATGTFCPVPSGSFPQPAAVYAIHAHQQLPHGFTNMAHVTQVRAHTCP